MIKRAPAQRLGETGGPGGTDGLRWALDTASTIRNRWREGASPDLAAVLAEHPKLKWHRTVVLNLAYEEYYLRLKAGEALDAEGFSRRFQSLELSLCFLIVFHREMDSDSAFAAPEVDVPWPQPKSHFLGFDLISEIGRGAIGRVFLAWDPKLERPVVVKVSLEGGTEAKILAGVSHRNIVPVYSNPEDMETGLTAICMPYLGQSTLASVFDRVYAGHRQPVRAQTILDAVTAGNQGVEVPDAPPPDRILRTGSYVEGVIHLGSQLADALAYAHAHGIFHRDIKLSNILMAPEGRPLLLDFNLSVDERQPVWRIGGTLPYMAPEELFVLYDMQFDGDAPRYDPRSDLFSLGVVLYELLAGCPPFGAIADNRPMGENALRLRLSQENGPHPLREKNRQVDKRLERLIRRCLEFDPDLRWENAEALAAALRKELTWFRRLGRWAAVHRWTVRVVAAVMMLMLFGTLAFFILRPSYAIRQFQQGLTYCETGRDDLALECLSTALGAKPNWNEALVARAHVYQQRGNFQMALTDYETANRLAPDPWTDACQGYCFNRLSEDTEAAPCYRQALKGGYASPAVLNNLGYSWLHTQHFEEAENCLRRALAIDDKLQAAHHNLLLVYLQRAYAGKPVPPEAFVHARRALETGPESGELCRNLAFLYALAAKQDAAMTQSAITYVAKAVAHGIEPAAFSADPVFFRLKQVPAFQEALVQSVPPQGPTDAVRVIDPLSEPRPALR